MGVKQHVEELLATIGGMLFAAWQGFLGDLLKVACAAAVSAVAGYLAKSLLEWLKVKIKKRFTKKQE